MNRCAPLFALATLYAACPAYGVTITVGGGVPSTSQGVSIGQTSPHAGEAGVTTETFNGSSGCGPTKVVFTGIAVFGTGNVPRRRKSPDGDQGCYMAVGRNAPSASATLSIPVPAGKRIDYIGFYLGSYDEYNFVSFGNGQGSTIPLGQPNDELSGVALSAMSGVPAMYSSVYLGFSFTESEVVRSITLRQTNFATEIDNFTYRIVDVFAPATARPNVSAVPAPRTLPLFMSAIVLAMVARMRRARAA